MWYNGNMIDLKSLVPYKRFILIGLACLAGLLILLYILQGVDSCSFNRSQEKKKEAVNNALQQAANVETDIIVDKTIANQIAANVKQATDEYLDAKNATDEQRQKVDEAIKRWEASKNSNRGNVSAQELERILEEIE